MDSPVDGDELARVVPLRRRDRELNAAPGARGSLPRERAPFDPEIEPGDTPQTARCPTCGTAQPPLGLRPDECRGPGTGHARLHRGETRWRCS